MLCVKATHSPTLCRSPCSLHYPTWDPVHYKLPAVHSYTQRHILKITDPHTAWHTLSHYQTQMRDLHRCIFTHSQGTYTDTLLTCVQKPIFTQTACSFTRNPPPYNICRHTYAYSHTHEDTFSWTSQEEVHLHPRKLPHIYRGTCTHCGQPRCHVRTD